MDKITVRKYQYKASLVCNEDSKNRAYIGFFVEEIHN